MVEGRLTPALTPAARRRVALVLSLSEAGQSYREIAERLGTTEGALKMLMSRAKVRAAGGGAWRARRTGTGERVLAALRSPGVYSLAEGARAAGVSVSAAEDVADRLGVRDALRRLYRLRRRARLRAALVARLHALAAELGRVPERQEAERVISPNSVWRMFGPRFAWRALYRAAGLRRPRRDHGRQKFSDATLTVARSAHARGVPQTEIARALGMSTTHLNRVLRGRTRRGAAPAAPGSAASHNTVSTTRAA